MNQDIRTRIKEILHLSVRGQGAHGPMSFNVDATEEEKIDAFEALVTEVEREARIDEIEKFLFNFNSLIVAGPRKHLEARLAVLKPRTIKEGL